MADNVGYTPGTGATIAADDIGGALHQRMKLTLGADGTSDGDVSGGNPMPVAVAGATPTTAKVDASDAAVTLAASAPGRRGLVVRNESDSPLYLKYGSGADWQQSYTDVVQPHSTWSMPLPLYTGLVSGVWRPRDFLSQMSALEAGVFGCAYVTSVAA